MRKRILSFILCIVMCLSLLPTMAFAQELPSMQNVKIENGILSWDAFPGADGYNLFLGSTGNLATGTSYDLNGRCAEAGFATGDYAVKIYAEDSDCNRISEAWTGTFHYVSTKPYLAMPTNLRFEGSTCKWDAVPYATSYNVTLLGEWNDYVDHAQLNSGTQYTFTLEAGKRYKFKVVASAFGYEDSEATSQLYTYNDTQESGYTVTFNMNGHGDQVAAQTVNEGEKATKPTDPTAEDWTFDGWYVDASCSEAFDFNSAINADTTVYAKWTTVEKYDLWVGGVQVTENNMNNVLGDGKVSYNPTTKTLTVADGANITDTYEGALIYAHMDLIIDGNLNLTTNGYDTAVKVYGTLTVNGNATFTTTDVGGFRPIWASGLIEVNGNVSVTGFNYGLYSDVGISVNGNVTATTFNEVLEAGDAWGITVEGNVKATVLGDSGTNAIKADLGRIVIQGDVNLAATGGYSNSAITAKNTIAVGGNVNIKDFKKGLLSINGGITVNGNVTANTEETAMYANGSIGMYKDVKIEVSGDNIIAVNSANGTVWMASGTWDITGTESAIKAKSGIEIPSTHAVTMPENGKIKTVDGNYTVTEVNGSTVAKHVIIKQVRDPETYTVNFDMNGHGDQVADQMVNAGEKVNEPSDPTAIGYMFGGWYKDSAFTTAWNFDTDTVTENTTLYALWAQNIQMIIESINVNVTAPAVGSHPDYSPVITATPNEVTSLCKVYLTPAWICADTESDLYNGNGTVMTAADTFEAGKYYAFSIQVNTLDAIVAGWQRSSTIVVTINGSVIDSLNHNVLVNTFGEDIGWLRAAWKMPDAGATATYTVNFNMNGHGTQVEAQTVKEGEKATKPADPTASGWTFDGWYADATFSAAFDFDTAIAADTTIYAKWTANSVTPPTPANYTVTFNMNGHGTQVAAQTVKEGEMATKPADPSASGYTFDGWYADATFSAKFNFDSAITANTTVYAKWTEVKKDEPTKPADPTNPTQPTKPADPTSPQTGDNSHLFLWIALLFISSSALAGTAVYGKKRKYNAK